MSFVSVGKNKKAGVKTGGKLFSRGLCILMLTEIGFLKTIYFSLPYPIKLFYFIKVVHEYHLSQKVLKGL